MEKPEEAVDERAADESSLLHRNPDRHMREFLEEIQGQYGILKKIAKNQFDEDFLILRKGDTVPHGFTFPVSTK